MIKLILPDYLTPSKINTFYLCPFKYWAHYIAKLPSIKTPDDAALFGSAIHNIITLYYDKISNNINERETSPLIEETFVEGADWRTGLFKSRFKDVQRNFTAFETERLKKGWKKPTCLEKRLRASLFEGLPPFEGIVDAYFTEGFAVDWKTGRYEEMNTERMVQGKIYEMLLNANNLPTNQVVFVNLTIDRKQTLPKINDGWISNIATQMVDMIKKEHFPIKENGLCESYCPFLLSCSFKNECFWGDVL